MLVVSVLRRLPPLPATLPAANLLKPALARGELHCIGATTVEEYRKHVEADGAFARRFQARAHARRGPGPCCVPGRPAAPRPAADKPPWVSVPPLLQLVMVEEPTPEEALRWLQGLRRRYERHHGVRFTDAALDAGEARPHTAGCLWLHPPPLSLEP
jgi:ATP-dependent Clp protease ATP-binding subunit ClpB